MRIHRSFQSLTSAAAIALATVALTACPPKTQMGAIDQAQLRDEQLKQQQLVITSSIREQQRLADVAYPMLKAALPICGKYIATRTGVRAVNAQAYTKDFQGAARSLGYGDTLTVVSIVHGSAGERAGVKIGDRILGVGGSPVLVGKNAMLEYQKAGSPMAKGDPALAVGRLSMVIHRPDSTGAGQDLTLSIAPDTMCTYGVIAYKNDALNAWATGENVVVTTAMMRFAASDEELAVVLSHEIAHDAMRHMDAKKKSAILGGVLGGILDVAAATQGINTGGTFSNTGAGVGANAYSQDFEREADYVGMYILARSNHPYADAPNFWRRMAQESPGSIKYATSHPTSAERFIRLDRTAAEIKGKQDAGAPLLPEAKVPGTATDSTKGRG